MSWAGERPDRTLELEKIKADLKPLREQAYRDQDVLAARARLDAAYRAYWDTVRAAMVRLDPSKKKLVAKDVASRKNLSPISSRVDGGAASATAAK